MRGVILAAGKGSRLFPVTLHIPKPLLPIANTPTLCYGLERLREIGVSEVCIIVGDNRTSIESAFGDGGEVGMRIAYATQTEPKGLAHAVSFAEEFVGGDPFVLYLGDAVYSDSLNVLRAQFEESGCENLNMVQHVDDPSRFGVAVLEGDRILKLVEKPKTPMSNFAMAGVYFFRSAIWDAIRDLTPSARGEYEITDAIQLLVERGHDVRAGIYRGRWFDTGTLDSFLDCSRFLLGNGVSIGAGATVDARMRNCVAVGEEAEVRCESLEDVTILPSARVEVYGRIEHCILGGTIRHEGDLVGQILWQ